jgi:hypothetical protein
MRSPDNSFFYDNTYLVRSEETPGYLEIELILHEYAVNKVIETFMRTNNRVLMADDFCRYVNFTPRPIGKSVDEIKIENTPRRGRKKVSLRIKWGHIQLSNFLARHAGHKKHFGAAEAYCESCGEEIEIPPDSYTDFYS